MKTLLPHIALLATLVGCAAAPAARSPLDKAPGPPPNIVFVLADDMRGDAMSCAGNPLLKTPNLDRLAAGGTRFNNAFLTTAICCVSRASILTGQYARRHGVNDFNTPLRDFAETYPALLRAAGYATGFIGKWGVAANDREYLQQCAAAFDFWAGDTGQSAYWHEGACNYITNNGTGDRTNFFCSCPAAARTSEGVQGSGPHPALKDPVQAETGFMPAKIRSFLDQRDTGKPFCLSVSLKAPHGPWGGYAPRFAQDFEGAAIPRRANVSLAEALRQPTFLRESLESDRGLRLVQSADDPDGERNRLMRQYYRLVEGVDFFVGELLRELDRRGLASNTVVIFTSDNGHFSGEHGFLGKWLMHEESIRAPMLVLDPRAPAAQRGRTCDEMVLNIDVAPTILELAGLPLPPAMQGQSLLPLLRDPRQPFRDSFFYEHLYGHGPKPPRHIERSEGVRTRDWKYTVYVDQAGPDREELYDLRQDPLELENLLGDPAQQGRLRQLRLLHRQYAAALVPAGQPYEPPIVRYEASSEIMPSMQAARAFDSNKATFWSSRTHTQAEAKESITCWFSGSARINYLRLTPRFSGTQALGFPVTFTLSASDGSRWQLLRTVTDLPRPDGNADVVLAFPAVDCKGLRVEASVLGRDLKGNGLFQLAELRAGYNAEARAGSVILPRSSHYRCGL